LIIILLIKVILYIFQGHHFNVATLGSRPYITALIPLGPREDGVMTFKMTGMFAEVFDNLQVNMYELSFLGFC
jgi:hypothetical protein